MSGQMSVDFAAGDIVSVEGHLVCGRCRNCMAGRRALCANTRGVGVNTNGGFAEFIAVPYTNIWKHKPDVDSTSQRYSIRLAMPSTRLSRSRYLAKTF